jgi:hypothetical protein
MNGTTGPALIMSRYLTPPLHPLANQYRMKARQETIKDACSKTMRWALHLASEELAGLERLNPETLGIDDPQLRRHYWKDFIESPESEPFRVQRV